MHGNALFVMRFECTNKGLQGGNKSGHCRALTNTRLSFLNFSRGVPLSHHLSPAWQNQVVSQAVKEDDEIPK